MIGVLLGVESSKQPASAAEPGGGCARRGRGMPVCQPASPSARPHCPPGTESGAPAAGGTKGARSGEPARGLPEKHTRVGVFGAPSLGENC